MLLACAQLCLLSYSESCPKGFTDVGDLRFGVMSGEEATIVVFRGSANAHNWMRDVEAVPPECTRTGHFAHRGFVEAVNDLWDHVVQAVSGINHPITFTGHSLGGAVAVLFAEELSVKAITFGSPRIWWDMSEVPAVQHVRVVCDDDPVPMVPHLLFQHDETAEVITLKDGGFPVDPADHFISHYIDRLVAGNYA
jgi:pimeloyl-ACP methyl ester carboxylesterase